MTTTFNNIIGAQALDDFRANNGGSEIISKLKKNKNILVNWAVGVGKSFNMDSVINTAITEEHYDLVIVLLPTRALIDERKFIKKPPAGIQVTNIRPRPFEQCGEERNTIWADYEKRGLGPLGKKTVCELCPKSADCFWPTQYGKKLRSSKVIFATQAHLKNNPNFISFIQEQSRAKDALVIFDEAIVSLTTYNRIITHEHLAQFLFIISKSRMKPERKNSWAKFLDILINAETSDLRVPNVWNVPALFPSDMRELLTIGVRSFGDDFRNIAYDLTAFNHSPLDAREKLNGDLQFPATPFLANNDVLLYSGTTDPRILNMRLGLDFTNPYEHYYFKGKDTRWLNIASSLATSSNFKKNSAQILDFFLELILRRVEEGKQILLISKKKLTTFCITALNGMLLAQGYTEIQVVHGDEYDSDSSYQQIPIIHYGVIGINKFEHFDCVYCLNSYYISPEILSDSIQDMRATDERIDLEIKLTHNPRRRYAQVADPKYRYTDVASVVNPMLSSLEMGTVIQAIGRVRPFTYSREVITFQNAAVPAYPYDQEFSNLDEARQHFGIKTNRERKTLKQYENIQTLKSQGLKQKEIAEKLQLSTRTVRRYWTAEKVDAKP